MTVPRTDHHFPRCMYYSDLSCGFGGLLFFYSFQFTLLQVREKKKKKKLLTQWGPRMRLCPTPDWMSSVWLLQVFAPKKEGKWKRKKKKTDRKVKFCKLLEPSESKIQFLQFHISRVSFPASQWHRHPWCQHNGKKNVRSSRLVQAFFASCVDFKSGGSH